MEQGLGSEPIDKSRVLNVRPLRCLAPMFPSGPNTPGFATPQGSPFVCASPTGPFPPGFAPFYPFHSQNESERPAGQSSQTPVGSRPHTFSNPIQSPVPLNSFRTPSTYSGPENGTVGPSRRTTRSHAASVMEGDGFSDSQNQSEQYANNYGVNGNDAEDANNEGLRTTRSQKRTRSGRQVDLSGIEFDLESVTNNLLTSFNLLELDTLKREDGDKDLVLKILLVNDLLRRKITQVEDVKENVPGATRRPDLKAGTTLMTKGVRTNSRKRVGAVPGVAVGDIFFFRMELCLVGLHSPSMAGIDYMSVKVAIDEEPIAVSIVSSGGYEDDTGDGDILIYSGQGGVQRRDKQMMDQKLERGNLALEKSLHRSNDVRVIRGLKDVANITTKVYVYDGLYKIQESWVEKGKSGCNVFKYKLVRAPGQPAAFALWKSIQQWKNGIASRSGVILPDLTSGAESLPVSLVNDVDDEKGPAYFTYFSTLKYSKPFASPKPSLSCSCHGGCQPGNPNCPCTWKNGGFLPYTFLGVIVDYKSLVHECGPSCACSLNCRNRVSQAGLKVRLEVFKTKDKGWGLRSWDPIRSGRFICEYAGEVIDKSKLEELGSENDSNYIFDATRTSQSLEALPSDFVESSKVPFPLVISAKNVGNVARFMNHSCSPNVFWRPVLRENETDSYLHIAFYAIRHIPPMQELTYDYGTNNSDKTVPRRKRCLCGSSKCRGYFY